MIQYHIDFSQLKWQCPMPGLRFKAYQQDGRRLRLVEYTTEMKPHWCEQGHFGYLLEGKFEIEFDDKKIIFNPGDGIFIPDGKEHRHKGKVLADVVRVIFVEDI